jgi:hypothetical protein
VTSPPEKGTKDRKRKFVIERRERRKKKKDIIEKVGKKIE